MATRAFLGTVSGSGSVAANWSGGAVPIAGDTIIGDGRAAQGLTSGCDFSGALMVDIKFFPTYAYALGSESSPFKAQCSGEFLWQGGGSMWTNVDAGAIPRTIIDTDSADLVTLGGTGPFTKIEWIKGTGTITPAATVSSLYISYRDNPRFDSDVIWDGSNGASLVVINGGILKTNTPLNIVSSIALLSGAGILDVIEDDGASGTLLTNLYQSGGVLNFRSTSSNMTITNHYFSGGLLSIEGSQATLHAITNMYKLPGVSFPDELRNFITITNKFQIGVP